ncbi:MAG TPA: hypothetical protein DCM54_06405 [Gammaproteobacteria bacterium]|nr:hypothetical protein [Gammaproteobacteria bacterium]
MSQNLFHPYTFSDENMDALNLDGHIMLPGLLTDSASGLLREALDRIVAQVDAINTDDMETKRRPKKHAAEYDEYLQSLIAHPQILDLARRVLGPSIRWDHCVSLVRAAEKLLLDWHTHDYAQSNPALGFIRIFVYIEGFKPDDGGLKVVPGSHLFRERSLHFATDEELIEGWLHGKTHPQTGEPLQIQYLDAPPGTVIVMWTHTLHGVTAKLPGTHTPHAVVYAYRNPGEPSEARWISEEFEKKSIPAGEELLPLY